MESQTKESQKLATQIQIDRLNHNLEKVFEISPILEEITKDSKELRDTVTNEITRFALSVRASKLDKSELNNFFNNPYILFKQKGDGPNDWHLAIPKFIDAQFGWLEKVTEGFNVFVVNPYVDWLGELPPALKQKVGMKDPLDVFLDHGALVGKDIKKVKEKYAAYISKIDKDRLIIDKSKHFELLAKLIKDGILPFKPQPVNQADLLPVPRTNDEWDLHEYHYEAWDVFLKYSNIGYFLPPSGGKTFLGIHALASLKGPHLVTVPSKLVREQWIDRIEAYTDLKCGTEIKNDIDVVVCTYQYAIKHGHKLDWSLQIVDECHHLPANLFSKLATLNRKYMIGLTATPQREDNREEYIFALTGKPCGLSWQKMKDLGVIQNPPMNVWIVKNNKERISKLESLLSYEQKTIIFCDSIELGARVARKFDFPHIHGSSKGRLNEIKTALVSVVSRVGDEGVSIPDIKRVIEINWLHGSRRQETQRFTRVLHGKSHDAVGHIIMTLQEYQTDRKRLFGIMDKGFKIILHREGYSEKEILTASYDEKPKKKKVRIVYDKKPRGNTAFVNEAEGLANIHPILGLPGIKKKIMNYSKNEVLCLKIMFTNKDTEYTKSDLCIAIGAGRASDFASFTKMQRDGLVVKTKYMKYKANLELSRLTK